MPGASDLPAADAVLVVSFGGPEGPSDVIPFLENVTRGRDVPRERLAEVAEHYALFDGVSPLNEQNRAIASALRDELRRRGLDLPVYLGNRNWRPFLAETLAAMRGDGVRHAIAFFTSGYSSYSGCRQYRENIQQARGEVGPGAPEVTKTRMFFNHPAWIEANADELRGALAQLPAEARAGAHVAFTAHSIPVSMARGCRYEAQLRETARLVAAAAAVESWELVYQSRSGPPGVPWLEPDVLDHLRALAERGTTDVALAPIGFVSDHLEVLYDLDIEAAGLAAELGLRLVRARTASTHPAFAAMVGELVEERLDASRPRRAVGRFAPGHDVCPTDCCLPRSLAGGARRAAPASTASGSGS